MIAELPGFAHSWVRAMPLVAAWFHDRQSRHNDADNPGRSRFDCIFECVGAGAVDFGRGLVTDC